MSEASKRTIDNGRLIDGEKLDNLPADVSGELALKEDKANKGVANGYASLDGGGKVPESQIPLIAGTGDVMGPASSIDNGIVLFDGLTGKEIKDSVKTITTTLGADDTTVPTSKAVSDAITAIPGGGDVTGPASAVDSNFASFDTTTGKLIKDSLNKASDFAPALGPDDNYVTDAEKIVIGNTSGTNTGDQDLSGLVTGPVSSTDNALARFDSTTGKIVQNGVVTEDDDGNLANVDGVILNLNPTSPTDTSGRTRRNILEHTSETVGDLGNILQNGQELGISFFNDTGATIPNGTTVRASSANGSGTVLVTLLQANNSDNIRGTVFVTTTETLNGFDGMMTRFGKVRMDTSSWAKDDVIYVSPTTAGELTNVRPSFPDYVIQAGLVLISAVDGLIGVNQNTFFSDTFQNAWDGAFRESIEFLVSSDGATITGTLQNDDGINNLTQILSTGLRILDVTPAKTVTLTAGTSSVPQKNYVYMLLSTPDTIDVATGGWPILEHIKIACVVLRDAVTTQTDGALGNQNWNDHLKATDDNGHILHMAERLRQLPASWNSGTQGISIVNGLSDVDVSVTGGTVYQLDSQTFPAFDTAISSDVHIVNDFVAPYKTVTNLGLETDNALGNTLNNSSFSFVLWGIQNRSGTMSHIMINLPVGSYSRNTPSLAVSDASNFAVYDIPDLYKNSGFLIARFIYTLDAGGTTWVLFDTEDLRGKVPNATAGGGGGGGTGATEWTGLNDTAGVLVADKFSTVNAGGTALELVKDIPAGVVVGTTDSQTLTNKTITAPLGIVTNDIVESTDKNFVTDGDLIVLGNTVGVNTGDNSANSNTGLVHTTGNETVGGIKTFSSSPIVPAPTTDLQAATKKYVDDNAGGGGITSSCRVYLSASQVIATGVTTKIAFDTEDYDTDGEFNTATNEFIATDTGKYIITASIRWTVSVDQTLFNLFLYRNGAITNGQIDRHIASGTGSFYQDVITILSLTAGDVITIQGNQTTGGNSNIQAGINQSTLSIHRLS